MKLKVIHEKPFPVPLGCNIQPKYNDKVLVKRLWKCPVPTNKEVRKILDLLKDYDPLKIALVLMLVAAPRPSEVVSATWSKFVFNHETSTFTDWRHYVYKPVNRKTNTNNRWYFKEVSKRIASKSSILNKLLLGYQNNCSKFPNDKVFPFSKGDSLNKLFSIIRKQVKNGQLLPEYECFLEKISEPIHGCDSKTQYRISPYSLRRFAITFLYWSKRPIGFDKDIVALARYIGHTKPATTYEHYVMPKESIGLTEHLIEQGVGIDDFIMNVGANQKTIDFFNPKPQFKFLPSGQATLGDFTEN